MISVWFLDTPLACMYRIFKGPFGFALTAFHFLCQYFNVPEFRLSLNHCTCNNDLAVTYNFSMNPLKNKDVD
jgi:hypothetical protein